MVRLMALIIALFAATASAESIVGIARIPDPPPPVDGTLERVDAVASTWSWRGKKHVTVGARQWQGDEDLSGQVFFGWDQNLLYVAAKVRDDKVIQPYFGTHLWKGDHLELFLDIPRQPTGGRDKTKVFQIGISPGNGKTGAEEVAAEVVRWTPTAGVIEGARVAAKHTTDGYQVEAAIPWKALGIEGPAAQGVAFGLEIALSDSDTVGEGGQESCMSLMTEPWALRDPDRMLEAVLGDTSGKVDPSTIKSSFVAVAENVDILRGKKVTIELGDADAKPIKELIVRARLGFKRVAGGTGALNVVVNGTAMDLPHVLNRLKTFNMGGAERGTRRSTGWFVMYAPNYDMPGAFSPYAVRGINPFEFRFDVSGLWKAGGGNVVAINHSQAKAPADLVVDVGVSETLSRKMAPPPRKPAPTGPIPTFAPHGPAKPGFTWRQIDGGDIEVKLGGRTWPIRSQFSTRAPGWAGVGDAGEFVVKRTVKAYDDRLHVTDHITNHSGDDLPVMVRHAAEVGAGVKQVYIAGKEARTPKYRGEEPPHPAAVALYDDAGIGLVSEDDVMRAAGNQWRDGDAIGVANRRLVVRKGATLAIEFSIYPLETGDYFAFLNRVRHNWGVNFTVPGSFTFISPRTPFAEFTDDELTAYLDNKTALIACGGVGKHRGRAAHGTGYSHSDKTGEIDLIARIKKVRPRTLTQVYLHVFISVGEDDATRFASDILRRPDGSHGDYSNPMYPIFVPREGSAFAKVQDELIAARWNDFQLDGIYWDELAYSAHKFDYSDKHWDGVTADIDPKTHRIRRKISSVALASQTWREKAAKGIMKRGLLVGNGAPHTRTFTRLHFPRFIETGSINNLTRGQLYTPIALGDHLTERTAADAYQTMLKALNFGGVYYWYYYRVEPHDQPTLTEHMFPITYIEMGPGFVIGKERIVTNRSGLFGWGDDSDFDAYVYDEKGKPTDTVTVAKKTIDGKTYAEVRIAEGYGVAIVRK